MKKATYAVAFITFLAFSSGSVAQELPRIFSGVISEVDGGGRTIVVKGDEKDMVFTIFEDTKIKTDYGDKFPLNELKNGMPVTVEYMKYDGSNDALAVKVNTMSRGFGKKQKERQKRR